MLGGASQRWELGRDTYRPAGETIRTSEYEVAEIPDREARTFVESHHYSRDFPASRFRFGLMRRGALVGVAVFSQPVNDRSVTNLFAVHPKQGVELGRLVLLDEVPGNSESFFVARCFSELRRKTVLDREGRELGGVLGVVSFSDPMPRRTVDGRTVLRGHWGCVYQALNAVYVGRADARRLHLLPDGRVFNHRTEQKIRRQEQGWKGAVEELCSYGAEPVWDDPAAWLECWLPKLTRPLPHKGNHKYAWALDRSLRRSLPESKPYPKTVDVAA